jgi:hypothetical protein
MIKHPIPPFLSYHNIICPVRPQTASLHVQRALQPAAGRYGRFYRPKARPSAAEPRAACGLEVLRVGGHRFPGMRMHIMALETTHSSHGPYRPYPNHHAYPCQKAAGDSTLEWYRRQSRSEDDPPGTIFESTVRLITGRTHQIRAQLAACGTPIIGKACH